jgi:hypothetical protein
MFLARSYADGTAAALPNALRQWVGCRHSWTSALCVASLAHHYVDGPAVGSPGTPRHRADHAWDFYPLKLGVHRNSRTLWATRSTLLTGLQ